MNTTEGLFALRFGRKVTIIQDEKIENGHRFILKSNYNSCYPENDRIPLSVYEGMKKKSLSLFSFSYFHSV